MKIIMTIPERLKDIRTYHDYTQKEIADYLGIARNTYGTYETNSRIIPLKFLNKLSNYYNVSVDYLLGLTDDSYSSEKVELNAKQIGEKLKEIRTDFNLTTRDIEKITSTDSSNYTKYELGKILVNTHLCYDLARKYGISVDWIIGKSFKKFINNEKNKS